MCVALGCCFRREGDRWALPWGGHVSRYEKNRPECSACLRSTSGPTGPADPVELAHARAGDHDAFRGQQRALHDLVPAVAAQTAARGDHAMTRHITPAAAAHDVAD